MEINPTTPRLDVAQPAPAPATPDKRPTADAAAMKRDPTPELPLAIPPATRQDGLTKSAMLQSASAAQDVPEAKRVTEAERTLKPYGVTMLPSRDGQEVADTAQNARPDPADG